LKESDPFSTIFTVHNDGDFAIYDLEFFCLIDRAEYNGPNLVRDVIDLFVRLEIYSVVDIYSSCELATDPIHEA